jgi:hypothetical protein
MTDLFRRLGSRVRAMLDRLRHRERARPAASKRGPIDAGLHLVPDQGSDDWLDDVSGPPSTR